MVLPGHKVLSTLYEKRIVSFMLIVGHGGLVIMRHTLKGPKERKDSLF